MFGTFADTLAKAKQSEFFVWFHLEEAASNKDTSTKHIFRPTSDKFHDLVAVQMTTDANDRLQAAKLMIQRRFIDHGEVSMFAADITKSFLAASLDQADIEIIAEAAMQIRAYQPVGSRMVSLISEGRLAPAPLAPGEGEPEYLTYAGKRRRFHRSLVAANLSMVNELVDGVENLTITISLK